MWVVYSYPMCRYMHVRNINTSYYHKFALIPYEFKYQNSSRERNGQ